MIITRTPLRISLFGGGTDFPEYYTKKEGLVISSTINKFTYISCKKIPNFIEDKNIIIYNKQEKTKNIEEIKNPLVKECIKFVGLKNLEIIYTADLPSGGLGTSSSFIVGLLKTLYSLKNEYPNKEELVKMAIEVECEKNNEYMGHQDQFAAVFGGFNSIHFSKKKIKISKINNKDLIKEINNKLYLFYVGQRTEENIEKDKIKNIKEKEKEYKTLFDIAKEALYLIKKENIEKIGNLLNESWQIKKKLSKKVSNDRINSLYDFAIENGAIGGKLLGAGNNGYMLFWSDKKLDIKNYIPFNFHNNGSEIIYKCE